MKWACVWFALCDRPADAVRNHPVLGPLPICSRCADRVGDPIAPAEREALQAAMIATREEAERRDTFRSEPQT